MALTELQILQEQLAIAVAQKDISIRQQKLNIEAIITNHDKRIAEIQAKIDSLQSNPIP